jgi:hypothetical protein
MSKYESNEGAQPSTTPDHGLVVTFTRGMEPNTAAAAAIGELLPLVDDEHQFAYYGHSLHLDFAGWGHRVPESVLEIRHFLQAVDAQWPWWIHFLTPNPAQWRALLLALAPITRQGDEWVTDVQRLRQTVLRLLRANRTLHDHFDIKPAASRVIVLQTWNAMKEAAR